MASPLQIVKKKADSGSTIGTIRDRANYQKFIIDNDGAATPFNEWMKNKKNKK